MVETPETFVARLKLLPDPAAQHAMARAKISSLPTHELGPWMLNLTWRHYVASIASEFVALDTHMADEWCHA